MKLLSCQKFRSGVRIELVCGKRALDHLSRVWEQNHQISNLLSAKAGETAGAVARLLEENQTLKGRLAALEDTRFAALAEQYRDAGDLLLFEEGLSPDSLRRLAAAVLETCGGRCACFSGQDGSGVPLCHRPGGRRPAGADPHPEPGPVRAGRRQAQLRPGLRPGGAVRHPGLFRRPLIPSLPPSGKEVLWTTRCTSCFGSFDLRLPGLADGDRPGRRPQAPAAQPRLSQRPLLPGLWTGRRPLCHFPAGAALRPLLFVPGRHDPGHRPGAVHRPAAGTHLPSEVVGLF